MAPLPWNGGRWAVRVVAVEVREASSIPSEFVGIECRALAEERQSAVDQSYPVPRQSTAGSGPNRARYFFVIVNVAAVLWVRLPLVPVMVSV
jgi:hypothetical protein